jgi:L-aspartate oxidase
MDFHQTSTYNQPAMQNTKKNAEKNVEKKTEALVIGSGLAGFVLALELADRFQVTICSKVNFETTNSGLAQGGIAAVMSNEDSFDDHIEDTLAAGAGLCNPGIVRHIVEQAPDRIRDLIKWGVKFDLSENGITPALTLEGGHSHRRILHIADHTGQEVHACLMKKVKSHPNIRILENHFALDLILNHHALPKSVSPPRCLGVYLLNKDSGEVFPMMAKSVFLATGGAGKVYLYTSNWDGATGDGIAIAARAGARVANLEFMQFHPTCLYHPKARNFLISEALRGEGGELVDTHGVAFMKKYHPLGSLAPRDIVARSIDAEMKKSGSDSVFLDMTNLSREFLQKRFPVIYTKCLELGIDMAVQPIPVVPAAHYLCGGVLTNIFGATDVENLYALGETACTGLHGANRLASNSLLECLVISHNAAEDFASRSEDTAIFREPVPEWKLEHNRDADELIVVAHIWDEIRRLMWNYVGIVRTDRRLERALHRLTTIRAEIRDYYSSFRTHPDIEELRNIALIAELTVKCAMARKESRGIHYSLDYPDQVASPKDTII